MPPPCLHWEGTQGLPEEPEPRPGPLPDRRLLSFPVWASACHPPVSAAQSARWGSHHSLSAVYIVPSLSVCPQVELSLSGSRHRIAQTLAFYLGLCLQLLLSGERVRYMVLRHCQDLAARPVSPFSPPSRGPVPPRTLVTAQRLGSLTSSMRPQEGVRSMGCGLSGPSSVGCVLSGVCHQWGVSLWCVSPVRCVLLWGVSSMVCVAGGVCPPWCVSPVGRVLRGVCPPWAHSL